MKFSQVEYLIIGCIILYVAFFTHPPPAFVKSVFSNPFGHIAMLLALVYVSTRFNLVVCLLLGIAYLLSSNPTLEYFEDPKKKEEKKEEKEQPSSGAPEPDIKGALGKLMAMQGKDVTKPPPQVNVPKPSTPSNVNKTEHFSAF
jgi:hypothetical protein